MTAREDNALQKMRSEAQNGLQIADEAGSIHYKDAEVSPPPQLLRLSDENLLESAYRADDLSADDDKSATSSGIANDLVLGHFLCGSRADKNFPVVNVSYDLSKVQVLPKPEKFSNEVAHLNGYFPSQYLRFFWLMRMQNQG
jgi:hypothetical protein